MSSTKMTNNETAVLIAVRTGTEDIDVDRSLDELSELALTAGATPVGRMIQNRESPDKLTYLGEGKVQELVDFITANEVDIVIADDELSPLQVDHISELTRIKVLDRTSLILDIFAQRAKSREGQLQVELAQLKYLMPRLKGSREELSRLGGGIGTRGPGETKLEVDRRTYRTRIAILRREIEDIAKNREEQRKKRRQNQIPQVSLVGYTNAGKSSLLAALTGSEAYVEDQLFATLDPLVRRFELPNKTQILLGDTVGFIRKLPHDLVAAFRATLEELQYASLLLHVVDSTGIEYEAQIKAVESTLQSIGCDVPILLVFAKADLLTDGDRYFINTMYPDAVLCSSKTGEGLDTLTEEIIKLAKLGKVELQLKLPYSDLNILDRLYKDCDVKSVEYDGEGLKVAAVVNMSLAESLLPYIAEEE